MKKDFTVILTRPDYLVEHGASRVFVAFVQSNSQDCAVAKAQQQVYDFDAMSCDILANSLTDYEMAVVFHGLSSIALWG